MDNRQEKYQLISLEIEEMAAQDQEMRKKWRETGEWDFNVDAQSTNLAKKIIEQIGYPTISKVGEKASHDFWLLVQHADKDLEFQKESLILMKSLPEEEVKQSDIAYLEDRVRAAEGKLLLYGTQFWTDPATGEYGSRPIEDPEHLDERRAMVGLDTFKKYEKIMREMSETKKKKNQDNKDSKAV